MFITEDLLVKALAKSPLAYVFDPSKADIVQEIMESDEEIDRDLAYDFGIMKKLPGLCLTQAAEFYGDDFLDQIFELVIEKIYLRDSEVWYITENLVKSFPNKCWPPKPTENEALTSPDGPGVDIRAAFYAMHYEVIATVAAIRERCKPENEKDPSALLELLVNTLIKREELAHLWRANQNIPQSDSVETQEIVIGDLSIPLEEVEPRPSADEGEGLFGTTFCIPIVSTFETILDLALESRSQTHK